MIPKRSPRVLALSLAVALVGALVAGPALAAKPVKPGGIAPAVPATVAPSTALDTNYVRFNVEFENTRNSSLQQVTMAADTPDEATLMGVVAGPLVDPPSQGATCDATGPDLSCTIGTVVAGALVTLSVVYAIPMTTDDEMVVDFIFTSTGAPGSDPGSSHGDDYPVSGKVLLDSTDFDGSYLFDPADLDVATNPVLTRRGNPQSTKVTGPETGIGVTVEEVPGNTNLYSCPAGETCFGQWSVINVNNGADYTDEGGFLVVIGYDQVPGNWGNVGFVHLVGSGSTFITESCDPDAEVPITVDCIDSVDNVSGDLYYTLIVSNNGPIRGI